MRLFEDGTGQKWVADLISHGTASGYLNRRVHRPILQFMKEGGRGSARYVGYSEEKHGPLEGASNEILQELLSKSKSH